MLAFTVKIGKGLDQLSKLLHCCAELTHQKFNENMEKKYGRILIKLICGNLLRENCCWMATEVLKETQVFTVMRGLQC
jgi:hypothetical protein